MIQQFATSIYHEHPTLSVCLWERRNLFVCLCENPMFVFLWECPCLSVGTLKSVSVCESTQFLSVCGNARHLPVCGNTKVCLHVGLYNVACMSVGTPNICLLIGTPNIVCMSVGNPMSVCLRDHPMSVCL
jgi:hypothetical protein